MTTKGFLLFAHNNEEIDYALLAIWCAKRIHQYLDKPVSIVADQMTIDRLGHNKKYFDKIILSEISYNQKRLYLDRPLHFNNYDRADAWNLTPYEETMIIDTDIVIQSQAMNQVWGSVHDVMICDKAFDAHQINKQISEFTYLSYKGIKFYWATQFYFKKNRQSEMFFKTCNWVRQHYVWLSNVYDIDHRLLRNDYVWSITAHMLGIKDTLPWTLLYTPYKTKLHSIHNNATIVYKPKFSVRKINNHDVHVMNKDDLVTCARLELESAND